MRGRLCVLLVVLKILGGSDGEIYGEFPVSEHWALKIHRYDMRTRDGGWLMKESVFGIVRIAGFKVRAAVGDVAIGEASIVR